MSKNEHSGRCRQRRAFHHVALARRPWGFGICNFQTHSRLSRSDASRKRLAAVQRSQHGRRTRNAMHSRNSLRHDFFRWILSWLMGFAGEVRRCVYRSARVLRNLCKHASRALQMREEIGAIAVQKMATTQHAMLDPRQTFARCGSQFIRWFWRRLFIHSFSEGSSWQPPGGFKASVSGTAARAR